MKRLTGFLLAVMLITATVSNIEVMAVSGISEAENEALLYLPSGGLEEIEAVELPIDVIEDIKKADEESVQSEEPVEVSDTFYAANLQQNAATSAAVNAFLGCGDDYGRTAIGSRNNGAGRQILYDKMLAEASDFTTGTADAKAYQWNTSIVYAFLVSASGYDFTSDDLIETYYMFRHDHPEFFWLDNQVYFGGDTIIVLAYDVYDTGTSRNAALNEIVDTMQGTYIPAADAKDGQYAKTLAIHDTLIADISYSSDTSDPISHSIAGAMTSQRSAVCEGYAKVMQLMLNYYDIPVRYVTGTGAGGGHAWNMVQMGNGKWYWLDATWDDQTYERYQHTFFLMGTTSYENNSNKHVADTPAGIGADYLYELPVAPDDDYVYDAADEAAPEITRTDIATGNIPAGDIAEIAGGRSGEQITVSGGTSFAAAKKLTFENTMAVQNGYKAVLLSYYDGEFALTDSDVIDSGSIELLVNGGGDYTLIYAVNGDIDADSSVTVKDVQLALKHTTGRVQLSALQVGIGDVSGTGEASHDNAVSIGDVQKLLKYVSKRSDSL